MKSDWVSIYTTICDKLDHDSYINTYIDSQADAVAWVEALNQASKRGPIT